MVAKLVLNEMGNYEYVDDVTTPKKPIIPSVDEFEAYEGTQQKSELVSAPSIGEQTQKVMRETPGQFKTTFDEKTGQFTTKETAPSAGRMVDYTPGEITPESTEPTALQKVMTMADQSRPEPIDYSKIISDAYKATQPTFKDQLVSTAIDVGGNLLTNYVTKKMTGAAGDIIINNMTQRVLGNTLSGSLAASHSGSIMSGASIVNPYTMAATALMTEPGKKVAKKAVKTVKKTAKKVWNSVSSAAGTVICTELYRQKLMSKEDYTLSWDFTINNFSKTHINGYWYWAVPMVKLMKKNKLVTKIWNHIMSKRTHDIKWRLGKSKFNLLGRIYSTLIENISYIIGKIIENKKTKEVLV